MCFQNLPNNRFYIHNIVYFCSFVITTHFIIIVLLMWYRSILIHYSTIRYLCESNIPMPNCFPIFKQNRIVTWGKLYKIQFWLILVCLYFVDFSSYIIFFEWLQIPIWNFFFFIILSDFHTNRKWVENGKSILFLGL